MGCKAKNTVILGAGIIGLSAAAACVRRGMAVTVVDQKPRRRSGCSFGNAGMVVPSHFVPLAAPGMVRLGLKWMWNPESPFYIKPRLDLGLLRWAWQFWKSSTAAHVKRCAPLLRDLNFASRELYAQMAQRGVDIGLVERGLLMLCKTQHALDEEGALAAQANALGVPAEVLDAAGTAKQDPGVTMDVAGSVFFPKDCHLQPERYLAALEAEVEASGGNLIFEANFKKWRKNTQGVLEALETSQGSISGDFFVLAGGSWSPELVQELGLRLPMQAGKGYSVTLAQPVELPQLCSIFTEARVAITPMGETLRFGGTMEIAGLNESITQRRVQGILKAIPNYFPKFQPEHFQALEPWSGLRPCSPDGMPYLGRTAAASNLVVATGHAMMGLSLAPVTGEIVARLLLNEPTGFDLEPLRVDRFA